MPSPFALPARLGLTRGSGARARAQPAADLDRPRRREKGPRDPEVSVCGIDPRVVIAPAVPTLHLVAADGARCPRSMAELLAPGGTGSAVPAPRDGEVAAGLRVRRLTVDVRHLSGVLDRRGGANLLAQIVRDPSDRVANAVFRAAMRTPSRSDGADGADTDCEVLVGGEGDSVAGRSRVDLGRARMMLLALLTEGERATRRLAEALARPRDHGIRHSLEATLAARVAELPLDALLRTPAR